MDKIRSVRYPTLLDIAKKGTEQKAAVDKLLKTIDEYPNKVQYVRIQILNWDETDLTTTVNEKSIPILIQGRVTGGNINLSGTSAIRRNGSLSLIVAEDDTFYEVDKINNWLSLNKKVKIEIGFNITEIAQNENLLFEGKHMNRIWFPLGIFVIKNPNLNRSLSGLTLSLTLSDKMCLLNGEVGGNLPATVVFSEIDAVAADGTYTKEYPLIKDIVQTLVGQYGGISVDKIIINDVPDTMKKILKWSQEQTLYQYQVNGTYFLDTTVPTGIVPSQTYSYNENIGYEIVPYTWPGATLTGSIGATITSILDKIKALGNYEYFFDINGNFIWQEKKTYTYGKENLTLTPKDFFEDSNNLKNAINVSINNNKESGLSTYSFYDETTYAPSPLVISYSNNPQYNNIKNDYIIWGKRKSSSGTELPIRYHICFDSVPVYSETIDTTVSYYKYLIAEPDVYGFKVVKNGGEYSETIEPSSNKYYTKNNKKYIYNFDQKKYIDKTSDIKERTFSTTDNWRTLIYFRGKREEAEGNTQIYFNNPFYKDLEIEWPKLYDMEKNKWQGGKEPTGDEIDYFCHIIDVGTKSDLNKSIVERYLTKTINDTNIDCIYFPDDGNNIVVKLGDKVPWDSQSFKKTEDLTPLENKRYYIFNEEKQEYEEVNVAVFTEGQTYYEENYQVLRVSDEVYQNLYAGGSRNSAFEQARQLICQYTSYANNISISIIPIYYLEPNTIIKVRDPESNIYGEYIINSISLPLAYNGNMTISASRAVTIV